VRVVVSFLGRLRMVKYMTSATFSPGVTTSSPVRLPGLSEGATRAASSVKRSGGTGVDVGVGVLVGVGVGVGVLVAVGVGVGVLVGVGTGVLVGVAVAGVTGVGTGVLVDVGVRVPARN
jgi:hypothetical protein